MTLERGSLLFLSALFAWACNQEIAGSEDKCADPEGCEKRPPTDDDDGQLDDDGSSGGNGSNHKGTGGSGGNPSAGAESGGGPDEDPEKGKGDDESASGGAATGGTGGDSGGTGSTGSGGIDSTGSGGADSTGSGGGGGEDDGSGGKGSVSPTVTGTVVDFYLSPIADVPVTIEGLGSVITDEDGEFVFEDVPARYDVEFVLQPEGRSYVYRFEGLSRRNPTLQVYGPGYVEYGSVLVSFENLPDGPETTSQAYASPVSGGIELRNSGWQYGVDWINADEVSTTLHALQWEEGEDDEDPTYTSYAATGVTLDGMGVEEITVGGWKLVEDTVKLATSVSESGTELSIFLHYDDGASIELSNEVLAGASKEYLVPALPGSAITVSASDTTPQGELLLSHVTVEAGQTVPELELPTAATLLGPTNNVTASQDMEFSWQPPSDSPCVLLYIESINYYSGARVVTCEQETTLSETFALYADEDHRWLVQTHGNFSSIDDMTTRQGYLDSFSYGRDKPAGTNHDPGTYTESQQRVFTTQP